MPVIGPFSKSAHWMKPVLRIRIANWWDNAPPLIGGYAATNKSFNGDITVWYHSVFTWSQSANQLRIYKNGVEIGSASAFPGGIAAVSAARIGSYVALSASGPWLGWLAHAAIWNTPLTPAQILSLATV